MNTEIFRGLLGVGCVFFAGLLASFALLLLVDALCDSVAHWLKERRRRHLARLQAERDARSQQLRRTILALDQQLAADRDEASRQMAKVALLVSKKEPPST